MPTTGVLSIGEDANITITPAGAPPPEKVIDKEEKPPEEKELTPEELKEMTDGMADALFGPSKPKEKAKPKADATPEPTPEEKAKKEADGKAAAEAEQKKKDDEAARAKKPKPTPKPVPLTADEIADKVADKLKPDPKVESKVDSKLSPEDQQKREVLAEMAKANPEEYGNHVKQFDRFIAAESTYRAKWEKANPEAEFNPEDDAHKEFYDEHQPTFIEDDYDNARIRVEARKITREENAQRETQAKFEHAREVAIKKLETVEPEVVKDLTAAVDPELANLKDVNEEDPLAAAAMAPHIRELAEQSAELVKAFTPDLNYRFNPENPLHAKIIAATWGYENELLNLPEDQRRADDGRMLAPIEEYNKMTPAQRTKHWTIWMEPNAVRALLIRDAAAKAKPFLDKLRAHAGKTAKASADTTPPKPKEEPAAKPAPAADKKRFPNTAGGADGVVVGGATPPGDTSFSKAIGDALWPS